MFYSLSRIYSSQFRHSSDILDRLPGHQTARSRVDQVEPGLFLGNMDAATDILSLEAHRISHIVTVIRTQHIIISDAAIGIICFRLLKTPPKDFLQTNIKKP